MSVLVGVAAVLRYENSVLMGLRKGSHGAGTWSFPGGHLEENESVFECASREVLEETGLVIDAFAWRKLTYTEDVFEAEGKHYITLYVVVNWFNKGDPPQPRVMEPQKCEMWNWFAKPPASKKLFLPVRNLLAQEHDYRIWTYDE